MPVFSVDPATCIKCGICSQVCPSSIIAAVRGKLPRMRKRREDDCIACGHCMINCPTGAAHIDVLPDGQMQAVDKALIPGPASVDMLCKSRRSVRRFVREPVDRETIAAIMDVARFAPTAKNGQPFRWIGLYERSRLQQLGNLMADWHEHLIATASALMPLQKLKLLAKAWRAGDDPYFRGAPHLILAVTPKDDAWEGVDSAIALTYLELAAAGRGIGCCWAGYATMAARQYPPIGELLGLGDGEIVSGGQMIGHPQFTPRAIPPRKKLDMTWI